MGSRLGLAIELPEHMVTVSDFQIGQTEVTVSEYAACVDALACSLPSSVEQNPTCNWGAEGRENHPLNCVDWNQAHEFALWIDARLPTEAEWEYAATSQGQDYQFPWGNEAATCDRAIMKNAQGISGCGEATTGPVCSKPNGHSEQGVCDMSGNVFEWVEDDYHQNYFFAPEDGSAWVDDPRGRMRMYRGGAFQFNSTFLRVRDRRGYEPAFRVNYLGFRVARDVPGQ
jgi:iron(II)-dependent oxidoreductase